MAILLSESDCRNQGGPMGTALASTRRWLSASLMAVTAAMILATTGNAATAATAVDDFSITVSPRASEVQVGKMISILVQTTTTSGASQPLTLTAVGLPGNATSSFGQPTVPSGGVRWLMIGAIEGVVRGTYQITVTATGTSASHSALHTVTITDSAACSVVTNPTWVQVPDLATAESTVTNTCTGNAAATSTVEVHIVHPYRGDLVVSLVAPDGTAYILSNREGGSADNLDRLFTVDVSSETRNGTWRLRVQDAASSDYGFITDWTLNLGSPIGECNGTNGTNVTIPDLSTVESTITVAGCTGNAAATSTVEVHIVHRYRGDLVVSLVARDGTAYILSNRQGGSVRNVDQTYTVDLSSETRNGAWRLRVQDAVRSDIGFIDSWTLRTEVGRPG
jgi:subtilisin-like proprotein convertase family protein